MAKFWCINCQAEREHATVYGQICDDNCTHRCATCNRDTLAFIQANPTHSEKDVIKQMVGEAQRVSQRTGKRGDIEVVRNDSQAQILVVYNTYSGNFRVNRQ